MQSAKSPDISICVAVYKEHAPPNLDSLVTSLPDALAGLKAELIIVLNGVSAESTRVPLNAVMVSFPINRGVPLAWNAAASRARASVLVFVNDDVILGRASLRLLHKALHRDPSAGVVGALGTHWDLSVPRHASYLDLSELEHGEMRDCDVVSGFLLATPTQTFNAIGGFDERFAPCGFEEVDYCTAVRLKANLRCCAVAGVSFQHAFGISASRRWRRVSYDGRRETIAHIDRRNRTYFRAKWSSMVAPSSEPAERR